MLMLLVALSVGAAGGPSAEEQARAIERALMAPCCWTQQVSAHASPAADRIRADIRARLAEGATRQEILAAYEAQYGPAILAEPPARGSSLLLYVLPPVALLASAVLLVSTVRRFVRRRPVASGEPAEPAVDNPRVRDELDEELSRLD
jgi:cytochrome c-type biogenesis protein CcmH